MEEKRNSNDDIDYQKSFNILGIEKTTSTDLINLAYSQQLKYAFTNEETFNLNVAHQNCLMYVDEEEEKLRENEITIFTGDELKKSGFIKSSEIKDEKSEEGDLLN